MPFGIPNIAQAGVAIRPDFAGFDNQVRSGLAPTIKGIGTLIAGAFAADAVIDWGREAISQASDLNESINAVNVTFGESAEGIKRLGEEAATAVGLSNAEFNTLAVSFANFTEDIAGPGGDVVQVMDDLLTRTADFASVMNLDVPEAAQKFRSALAGESEPLRRFGIDVSAAAVNAEALKLGLADTTAELTEQDKILARYQIIMEETANTAGDFANTSDDLANKQRILTARMRDTQAELGRRLVPVFEDLLDVASELGPVLADGIAPALTAMTDAAEPLVDLMQTVSGSFGEAADGASFFERVIGATTRTINPIGTLYKQVFGKDIPEAVETAESRITESEQRVRDEYLLTSSVLTDAERFAREAFEGMGEGSTDFGETMEETARVVADAGDGINIELRESLRQSVDLFQGAVDETELSVAEFIANLEEQAEQRAAFLTNIRDLESAGLDDLAQLLADAGPEMAPLAAELAGDLTRAYEAEERIEEATRQSLDNIRGLAAEYTPILQTAYSNLGKDAAEGFIQGYFGVGIVEKAAREIEATRDRIRQLEGISSPSRVWADEIGMPLAEGVLDGIEEGLGDLPGILTRYTGAAISEVQRLANDAAAAGTVVGGALGSGFVGALSELPQAVRNNIQRAIDQARQTVRDAGFNPPPDPREAGTPGRPGRGFVEPTVGGRTDPIFQGDVVVAIDSKEIARAVNEANGTDTLRLKTRAGEGTFW